MCCYLTGMTHSNDAFYRLKWLRLPCNLPCFARKIIVILPSVLL
ncbi:hypothetical protein HMPREF9145_0526 [Segatella salivae F0493]|uniref:Uncharacterized protein n=1 Tax=Segatella salivae F0493 TaxID=1395125 RepID=U2MSF0_9BACT|nr:hypothetical protein HMPREF9145_0526 [Segatella salivae F0493]